MTSLCWNIYIQYLWLGSLLKMRHTKNRLEMFEWWIYMDKYKCHLVLRQKTTNSVIHLYSHRQLSNSCLKLYIWMDIFIVGYYWVQCRDIISAVHHKARQTACNDRRVVSYPLTASSWGQHAIIMSWLWSAASVVKLRHSLSTMLWIFLFIRQRGQGPG